MNIHTIAQLLDIADPDSSITDIRIEGHTKFITVSKIFPGICFVLSVVPDSIQKAGSDATPMTRSFRMDILSI